MRNKLGRNRAHNAVIFDTDALAVCDTQGRWFFISEDDVGLLVNYYYARRADGYAYRSTWDGAKAAHIGIHRDIIPGSIIDHIDGNPANNRRTNLRKATKRQNQQNRNKTIKNKSGYKGVVEHVPGKFRAVITHKGRQTHLGVFTDPIDAAKAYDIKARGLFGEFARLNFP